MSVPWLTMITLSVSKYSYLMRKSVKITQKEDPNAPQKVQDLPKACLKDEEPFNIQNSLSPKHESGKGDPDIVDVNCVLNNLT
ncbi:chondroitin sulfate proteoglycan 5-like isoform X5 [Hyla sarda]|uniref:chondroitin sulfate proteoglycan 5-like isoform X5 n=1 Tax=Hyla sarda TaxID=327740 RepID=UPI0024C2D6D0|nr:chondroitin sulfate proteoglycan 5-like isoform X5 [Hyla sarda]XP_056374741.1 chondroitin sulfate proteoglycan 5-like isoform X5 [Hyla sarda]